MSCCRVSQSVEGNAWLMPCCLRIPDLGAFRGFHGCDTPVSASVSLRPLHLLILQHHICSLFNHQTEANIGPNCSVRYLATLKESEIFDILLTLH
jgi:hypothetical protein